MSNWYKTRRSIKNYAKNALINNMGSCSSVTMVFIISQFVIGLLNNYLSPFPATLTGAVMGDQPRPLHALLTALSQIPATGWVAIILTFLVILMMGAPLFMGINGFFMRLVRRPVQGETPPKTGDIFKWYMEMSRSVKSVLLHIVLDAINIAWNAVFVILPAFLLYTLEEGVAYRSIMEVDTGYAQKMIGIALFIGLAMLLASLRMQAFMPAPYLMAQQPELSTLEAIKLSMKITKGHLFELFLFQMSFILWYIFAVFTMGIAYLYIFPYREAAVAAYIRKLHFDYLYPEDKDGVRISIQSKVSKAPPGGETEEENK